ncbi:hypothetical protein CO251_02850 [Sulfobacillus sp. hq2]|nr:hypothetical protein CO251_02850 [Sulfobacillus sp. hq2]
MALFSSQVLSIVGGRFIELGIPWLLLATNHGTASTTIMAIIPLVTAVTALPLGRWVRTKRLAQMPAQAELIQGGIFFAFVILMVTGVLRRFVVPGLVIALILIGMFSTVTRITLTPQVRSIFGRDSMIRVSNYLEGADAIGTVIGPVLAGVIFSVWGGMGIFGALTLLFVGSSLGLAILGRHDATASVQTPARLNHVFDGLRVLITPPLLTLSVVDWVANFVSIAVVFDLVLIVARHLHLPDSSAGLVFTLSGIGNFVAVVILDRIQNSRRFHPVKTLGIALGVSVLGSVVLLTSGTYYGLTVGYVVLDGGMAAIFVMNGAIRNMVTPEDKLVAMRAGITFSNQMVRAIGSMVPGVLFAWWNGRILLGIVALCGVALLALVWFGRSALSENIIREGATQQ